MTALISVIIPAYNQASFLGTAIQSVLDQTLQEFEIVVVDDGSTDNTVEVVHDIPDSRIKYVYQNNAGLSAARNTGIRESSSEFVSFLDSDDVFLPNNLESLYGVLQKDQEVGFVAGQVAVIDENSRYLNHIITTNFPEDPSELLLGNQYTVGAILLRRELLSRVGFFDESLRACEDWDLWLRFALTGSEMKSVPYPVSCYRFHTNQMTREPERMRKAWLSVLDKVYQREDLPEKWINLRDLAYSQAYLKAACRSYLAGKFQEGHDDLLKAISLDPALRENNYKELIETLEAWINPPRSPDPKNVYQKISMSLPLEISDLKDELKRSMSNAILGQLFLSRKTGSPPPTGDIIQAIQIQPKYLFNRGVISRIGRNFLQSINKQDKNSGIGESLS